MGNSLAKHIQGCNHCLRDWFESLENVLTKVPDDLYYTVSEYIRDYMGEDGHIYEGLCCPVCRSEIEDGDRLITDLENFKEVASERIAEDISDYIAECEYCDSGLIAHDQRYSEPYTYEQLLAYELSEVILDEVEDLIVCRGCGRSVGRDGNVASSGMVDRWYGDDFYEERDFLINSLGILESQANDFLVYLKQHPMMALNHEIGLKLLELIKSRSIKGIDLLIRGSLFYRARKRNKLERHVGFVDSEMWAPPFEIASNGRFNTIGSSVLYLANSPKTAVHEVGSYGRSGHEVIEVAQFELLKDITVLDIRSLDCKNLLSIPSMNLGKVKTEYLLPNFISQCCSVSGIEGIVYDSVKEDTQWNLALLIYDPDETIKIIEKIVSEHIHDLVPFDPTIIF